MALGLNLIDNSFALTATMARRGVRFTASTTRPTRFLKRILDLIQILLLVALVNRAFFVIASLICSQLAWDVVRFDALDLIWPALSPSQISGPSVFIVRLERAGPVDHTQFGSVAVRARHSVSLSVSSCETSPAHALFPDERKESCVQVGHA